MHKTLELCSMEGLPLPAGKVIRRMVKMKKKKMSLLIQLKRLLAFMSAASLVDIDLAMLQLHVETVVL